MEVARGVGWLGMALADEGRGGCGGVEAGLLGGGVGEGAWEGRMVGRGTEKVERRMVGQGYVGLGEGLLYVVGVGRLEGCHASSLLPHGFYCLSDLFCPPVGPQGASLCWVSPLWWQWGRNDWTL